MGSRSDSMRKLRVSEITSLAHFCRKGRQFSGTYLPNVATEQGWNQEETLISLIRKAGFKGQITADFINSLSVTRYQSQTCSFSYEQYLQAKQ